MVWMTLVLSFALLGQVEARNGRLNKRRLSLERRGGAAAAGGQNGNTGVSGNKVNVIGETTSVVDQAGLLAGSLNKASTQIVGAAGAGGAGGQATGALNGVGTTIGTLAPGSPPPG